MIRNKNFVRNIEHSCHIQLKNTSDIRIKPFYIYCANLFIKEYSDPQILEIINI